MRKPTEKEIETLKSNLIQKIKKFGKNNAVTSIKDGNIIYTLLFCGEGLKLYGRYFNYSKCFFTIEKKKMKQELKEVLEIK